MLRRLRGSVHVSAARDTRVTRALEALTRAALLLPGAVLPALLLLSLLLGCDPLASGAYRGEPLLVVRGSLSVNSALADDDNALSSYEVRIGMVWMDTDGHSLLTSSTTAAVQQTVTRALLPARFELALYEPPAAAGLTLGWVFVYEDRDGSGAFEHGRDALVGWSQASGVVYSPAAQGRYPAGFTSVEVEAEHCGSQDWVDVEAHDLLLQVYPSGNVPVPPDINCDGSLSEWAAVYP